MGRREQIMARKVPGETPDPSPVHVPGKSDRPLSLREEMRRFVREELSKQAQQLEAGTFDDEDDFSETDPDPDLTSPYTVTELTPEEGGSPNELEGAPTAADLDTTPPEEPILDSTESDDPAPSPESP